MPSNSIARLLAREWQILAPGVYVIHRSEPPWLAKAWAGVLLGGDGAKLGFAAAAHHLDLADQPEQIEVWTKNGSSRRREDWVFRRDGLGRRAHGKLPTTTIEDTVIDLCPSLDADAMAALIGKAVGNDKTTVDRLAVTAKQRNKLGQRRLIYEVLGLADDGVHSALERRFVTEVERPHALPVADRQIYVSKGARVDVFYEVFGLVVELDGKRWHTAGRRDLDRDNINATLGLHTLRYGWADVVSRPCDVAGQIAAVLEAYGWEGAPRACVRCRRAQAVA